MRYAIEFRRFTPDPPRVYAVFAIGFRRVRSRKKGDARGQTAATKRHGEGSGKTAAMASDKIEQLKGLFSTGLSGSASAAAPCAAPRKARRRKESMSQTMKTLKSRGINIVHSDQTPEWYMIDARTSVHIAKWDLTLVIALLLVAILTPFEVAFLPPPQAVDWLFVMNRVLDVIFAVDMVVVCFRIVSVTSHVEGMRWIVEPRELFRRYCKSGWFFIDLFTLIVSAMDIIAPMLEGDSANSIRKLKVSAASPFAATHPLSALHSLRPPSAQMLRVLRVVRLTRLAKLLSNSRTLQELETQLLVGRGT